MKSKDEIRSDLQLVAANHEMTGEGVDMIIDLLTYSLYHEQVEIVNTAKEMSLNDAYSINSKIALCDNVMYSVYRGKCPVVHLNVHFDSMFNDGIPGRNISKFDLLYTSNTFYLYASDTWDYDVDDEDQEARVLDAILTRNPIIEKTVECTYNQYYIDLVDDVYQNTYGDISDDVTVYINDKEYETTRLFMDHCRYDDKIFVLTIPGYGIRLYKKKMFDSGSTVKIKAIVYTTMDDINESDIDNIKMQGVRFIETEKEVNNETVITPAISYTEEIARQDAKSFLYMANFAGRVDHEIKSNSDVNYLFTEVFIDKVEVSTFDYLEAGEIDPLDDDPQAGELTDDRLVIAYIPKAGNILSDEEIYQFKENYGSYFICNDIKIYPAHLLNVIVYMTLILTNNESVHEEVTSIFETNFNKKLGLNVNFELMESLIAKIPNVKYVKNFDWSVPERSTDETYVRDSMKFFEYVNIVPNITYAFE